MSYLETVAAAIRRYPSGTTTSADATAGGLSMGELGRYNEMEHMSKDICLPHGVSNSVYS